MAKRKPVSKTKNLAQVKKERAAATAKSKREAQQREPKVPPGMVHTRGIIVDVDGKEILVEGFVPDARLEKKKDKKKRKKK